MWRKIARKFVVGPILDKLEDKGVLDRLETKDLKDTALGYLALQDHIAEAKENGASGVFSGWEKVSFKRAEEELGKRKDSFYRKLGSILAVERPETGSIALMQETSRQGDAYLLALAQMPKAKEGREFLVQYAQAHPEFEIDKQATASQAEDNSWASRHATGLQESGVRR